MTGSGSPSLTNPVLPAELQLVQSRSRSGWFFWGDSVHWAIIPHWLRYFIVTQYSNTPLTTRTFPNWEDNWCKYIRPDHHIWLQDTSEWAVPTRCRPRWSKLHQSNPLHRLLTELSRSWDWTANTSIFPPGGILTKLQLLPAWPFYLGQQVWRSLQRSWCLHF